VLWKVHSKDHAVTALSSRTTHRETITRSALHHYQGRNCPDWDTPKNRGSHSARRSTT
jgi:hypothetical protein